MKKSVALVLLCSLLSVHALNAPSISFLGETLPDHGYVDLSLVGDAVSGGDSVQCRTDLSSCCGNIDSGDWFAPNGSRIPFSDSDSDIYKVPGEKRIDSRQRNSNEISGIYRCDIETMATVNISDSNSRAVTRESIYVGLYANGGIILLLAIIIMDTIDHLDYYTGKHGYIIYLFSLKDFKFCISVLTQYLSVMTSLY